MEKRHSCPDGSSFQCIISERYSKVLAIEREGELPLFHIQIDPKDSFLLKWFAVDLSLSVAPMSELAKTIETKAKVIVAKGVATAELLLGCYTYFEFVIRPCIGDDFPVVMAIHEGSIGDYSPEKVVVVCQERMSVITRERDLF